MRHGCHAGDTHAYPIPGPETIDDDYRRNKPVVGTEVQAFLERQVGVRPRRVDDVRMALRMPEKRRARVR